MCDQQSLRSACAYVQSDQSLCQSIEYYMTVKLLTEHHLEFLSLKGDCTGLSESTLVKMPHCWKSHVTAHMCLMAYARNHGETSVRNVQSHQHEFYRFLKKRFLISFSYFVLKHNLIDLKHTHRSKLKW